MPTPHLVHPAEGHVRAHRRWLALSLALVLVAAVATVGLLRGADRALLQSAPQDQPGPVLLVPGYGGSLAAVETWAARLRAEGRTVVEVHVPGEGFGDLREQAAVLDEAVARSLDGGAPSVDLIGFSAGGVVVRLWLEEHGEPSQVRRVLTLGSPHHGTRVAALAAGFLPHRCPLACQQLVPGSDLLAGLPDEVPPGPRWTSVWTDQDEVVVPADSARLDGARNIRVQDVCTTAVINHSGLTRDPFVSGLVVRALGEGLPRQLGPAECAPLQAAGVPPVQG
jgi:triacylglycerol lipase